MTKAPSVLTSTQGKGTQRVERWDVRSRLVSRCLPMSHFPHLLNEWSVPCLSHRWERSLECWGFEPWRGAWTWGLDMGSQSMAERVWIQEAQGWVGWRIGIVAGRVRGAKCLESPPPEPYACI